MYPEIVVDLSWSVEATGMPGATMKWKYYWRDIVKHLHVVLEGWPADIPMGNLSDIATSQPILQQLHDMVVQQGDCVLSSG